LATSYSARIALARKKLDIRIRTEQVRTAEHWADMVLACAAFAGRRSDWQANMAAILRALVDSAWGPALTTRTTWDKLMNAVGVSRRTIASGLAWLREHGFLHTQRTGVPAARSTSGRNEAPVYQLTISGAEMPVVSGGLAGDLRELAPLFTGTKDLKKPHAREGFAHGAKRRVSRHDGQIQPIGVDQVVTTKRDGLRWARTLRDNAPELAGVGLRRIRWLTKALWRGGWTVRDALGALEMAPDGSPWAAAGAEIRSPARFALAKLQRWAASWARPTQAVTDRGHQRLMQVAHAATKTPTVGFGGTGTPAYTAARQVVHTVVEPDGCVRISRTGGLHPWEQVRVGVERQPGLREVVATLTNQNPTVALPRMLGDLYVRVDNDGLHSDVLPVDLNALPEPDESDGNGLGFLRGPSTSSITRARAGDLQMLAAVHLASTPLETRGESTNTP
jgi:hypothetical protein